MHREVQFSYSTLQLRLYIYIYIRGFLFFLVGTILHGCLIIDFNINHAPNFAA